MITVPPAWHLRDPERGRRNLAAVAEHLGADGLRRLLGPLGKVLPRGPDPDMALVLERADEPVRRVPSAGTAARRLPDDRR